jgi:hypothetical protein
MVFKLVDAAQKSWRRLDEVILGAKFTDGLEVVATRQPNAAALSLRPSPSPEVLLTANRLPHRRPR